jgi:hypothetical protein
MINYQNGRIYAIRSHQTELIYIGSTTQSLSQRIAKHKINYKNNGVTSSREILKYPDYYIELIELFPCNSREELEKQEGIHIRKNINICVNCRIAGRTMKEYYIDNTEQFKEQVKQYRLNNLEKIKEYNKQYRLNNLEKIKEKDKQSYQKRKEKHKQYRLDNAERIKEQQKQYHQKRKELKEFAKTEETNILEN